MILPPIRHRDRQPLWQKELLHGAPDRALLFRPVATNAPVLTRVLHFLRGQVIVPGHDPARFQEGPVRLQVRGHSYVVYWPEGHDQAWKSPCEG